MLFLRFLFLSLDSFDLSALPSHSRDAIRSLSGRCLRFPAIARGEPVALHSDRIQTVLFLLKSVFLQAFFSSLPILTGAVLNVCENMYSPTVDASPRVHEFTIPLTISLTRMI